MSKRVVVVGGVAGGMSCAARLRRLDESTQITVFEKGNDVSFANCGMPYYVGGVIAERGNLLVQTEKILEDRYALDIRTRHEVTRIDRSTKCVEVKDLLTGKVYTEPYDMLVLSPGSEPFRPDIPGIGQPNVYVLNNLADMDAIHAATTKAKSVCIVGAGFIGLELAENFRRRGLDVHLVEMLDQVLGPMDKEMTQLLLQELRINGVDVRLGETVARIDGTKVTLKSGADFESDFICICTGVRPRSELALEAGIETGPRGHIRVNDKMQTSDPNIYAVGDVVETFDYVTTTPSAIPLAGPANRQGRIAADVISGRSSAFPGIMGTSIVKVFNLAAASTGLTEKRLKALGLEYQRVYVHPMQHPKYYPNAQPVSIKLLFSAEGRIYGAQLVGTDGVEPTVNVLATAIRGGLTVYDLEQLELAYSPQWGGAKHGINMAGFTAANVLRGDVELLETENAPEGIFWLDVRAPEEVEAGTIPGATVIPVDALRARVNELPRDKEIGVFCAVGLRGYIAYRYLKQKGFRVRNLNGGFRTWCWYRTDKTGDVASPCCKGNTCASSDPPEPTAEVLLDVCGLQCPGPISKVKQAMDGLREGDVLRVVASDPGFAADIPAWCQRTGNTLLEVKPEGSTYVARIARGGTAPATATRAATGAGTADSKTIVVFSNDLDRAMASFVIANGAAAMGSQVTMFFTFWGLNVLRKPHAPAVAKGFLDRMFGMMMPKGVDRLKLSKLNMGGIGTRLMKYVMKSKNVMSLPELIASAQAAGIRLVACSMSMDVMGIKKEELIDGVEIAGVGNYLGAASESNVNLFI